MRSQLKNQYFQSVEKGFEAIRQQKESVEQLQGKHAYWSEIYTQAFSLNNTKELLAVYEIVNRDQRRTLQIIKDFD